MTLPYGGGPPEIVEFSTTEVGHWDAFARVSNNRALARQSSFIGPAGGWIQTEVSEYHVPGTRVGASSQFEWNFLLTDEMRFDLTYTFYNLPSTRVRLVAVGTEENLVPIPGTIVDGVPLHIHADLAPGEYRFSALTSGSHLEPIEFIEYSLSIPTPPSVMIVAWGSVLVCRRRR